MRLDEWQRYIDSEFVEDNNGNQGSGSDTKQRVESIPLAAETSPGGAVETDAAPVPSSARDPETADETTDIAAADTSLSNTPALTAAGETGSQPQSHPLPPSETGSAGDPLLPGSQSPVEEERSSMGLSPRRAQYAPLSAAPKDSDEPILPFADYISRRVRGPSPAQSAPPEPDSSPGKDPEAARGVNLILAPGMEPGRSPVSGVSAPLSATSEDLRALIHGGSERQIELDAAVRKRRDALVMRLLNPVLPIDETALLLGVTPTTVQDYASNGQLTAFQSVSGKVTADRRPNPDSRPRSFRLSDIVSFIKRRSSAAGSETEPGHDRLQDETS